MLVSWQFLWLAGIRKTQICVRVIDGKYPPPPPQTNGLKSDINEEIEHFRPILLIIGPRTFKFAAEYIKLIRTEVRNVPEFSSMATGPI